jgi:hypothetical protein
VDLQRGTEILPGSRPTLLAHRGIVALRDNGLIMNRRRRSVGVLATMDEEIEYVVSVGAAASLPHDVVESVENLFTPPKFVEVAEVRALLTNRHEGTIPDNHLPSGIRIKWD